MAIPILHCFCNLFPDQIQVEHHPVVCKLRGMRLLNWASLKLVSLSAWTDMPRSWLVSPQAIWMVWGNLSALFRPDAEVSMKWGICALRRWIELRGECGHWDFAPIVVFFSGELLSHCSVLIRNGALGDAQQRLLYIFKVAARGCVSLGSFSRTHVNTKGYLSLSLGCIGSYSMQVLVFWVW